MSRTLTETAALIRNAARARVHAYAREFAKATPFKHVVIDDFFTDEALTWLLDDFPPFEERHALNEMGEVGGKAVHDDLAAISPNYARIQAEIASRAFRDFFCRVSGIPDLLHDDSMYGGGTHENLDGQELDPHVDFNYDERHGWHRRLNALIFLNREWDESWGGAVEIHSDPWNQESNEVKSYSPILNRCVLFETNEHSWHGFPRIQLPADKKHLSRRSLSIYFYTKERPAEEIAPSHATFYVQRPLPASVQPGATLSQTDYNEIQWLLRKRDLFLRFHQQRELRESDKYERLLKYHQSLMQSVRLPMQGYVVQRAQAMGYHFDGWVEPRCRFSVSVERALRGMRLEGFAPEQLPFPVRIDVRSAGAQSRVELQEAGRFTLELPLSVEAGAVASIDVQSSARVDVADDPDQRPRAFILQKIVFDHVC